MRRFVRDNSLSILFLVVFLAALAGQAIVMAVIFVGAWFAQSVTGWTQFNEEQAAHGAPDVSWWSYVGSSNFWEATFQNWQSEFLAVGSFAVLAVFLRQRGSPESKPVGARHETTGVEG
jgi:hypothetical protein